MNAPAITEEPSPSRSARSSTATAETAAEAAPFGDLLHQLAQIHHDVLSLEREFEPRLAGLHVAHQTSARNLIHYLALRRHDLRELQEKLAKLGLSSLGRTESHVQAAIEAVLKIMHKLAGREWHAGDASAAVDFAGGAELLRAHTQALLGPAGKRNVRIMVTMPTEAAHDFQLVRRLLAAGMDCMRINCAHDDAGAWEGMVANLRRAQEELGRECRVQFDLAGPKLRTGQIDPAAQIVKWSPQRDAEGRVQVPAKIWLTPEANPDPPPADAAACLCLPSSLLAEARSGDGIKLTDLRGKSRALTVAQAQGAGRWATCEQTAYLSGARPFPISYVPMARHKPQVPAQARVLPSTQEKLSILLQPGDTLVLTSAAVLGRPAVRDSRGAVVQPAAIACTLPEVFANVRPGEHIWFDDGKIGGVIEAVDAEELRVRITAAKPSGEKLGADKGINLPDTDIHLPALMPKDLADLELVVRHADLVGMSFVRRPEDVRYLQAQLAERGAAHLGVVLKIETRAAFDQLPSILLEAMRAERVGVMIARGDLAVECGWERLAEVQEEILWVCEAAHIPVIWATQVLESLAKKGVPSRAEITDAAMGERAECVMLNKGPHLVEAVRVLDDILCRMEAHQHKKTARLRRLRLSAMEPTG